MLCKLLANKKAVTFFVVVTASVSSELERIRTPNLLIRSQVLYPVELLVLFKSALPENPSKYLSSDILNQPVCGCSLWVLQS